MYQFTLGSKCDVNECTIFFEMYTFFIDRLSVNCLPLNRENTSSCFAEIAGSRSRNGPEIKPGAISWGEHTVESGMAVNRGYV